MKKGLVSIIIVNYNGKDLLKSILSSLEKSDYNNFEIIVVDNKSNDGSQEFIKKNYKIVKLVSNKKNLGYSGINSALKFCNGEFILFLNNDMEIDKNCIGNLVNALKREKNAVMAAPRLVNFYNKELKSGGTWISRAFYNGHIKGNVGDSVKEIPYLGVGLIRKDFVEMFGYLFDPDYFIYAEDVDLGLRIRLAGKKAVFVPDAIMQHMHAVTMQKANKSFSTYLMERNLLITYFKILSWGDIILYLPYVLSARIAALIKDLVAMKIASAFARFKAIFFVIFNFTFVLKKRHQTQKFRKVNDEYILKIFTEKYLFKPRIII